MRVFNFKAYILFVFALFASIYTSYKVNAGNTLFYDYVFYIGEVTIKTRSLEYPVSIFKKNLESFRAYEEYSKFRKNRPKNLDMFRGYQGYSSLSKKKSVVVLAFLLYSSQDTITDSVVFNNNRYFRHGWQTFYCSFFIHTKQFFNCFVYEHLDKVLFKKGGSIRMFDITDIHEQDKLLSVKFYPEDDKLNAKVINNLSEMKIFADGRMLESIIHSIPNGCSLYPVVLTVGNNSFFQVYMDSSVVILKYNFNVKGFTFRYIDFDSKKFFDLPRNYHLDKYEGKEHLYWCKIVNYTVMEKLYDYNLPVQAYNDIVIIDQIY